MSTHKHYLIFIISIIFAAFICAGCTEVEHSSGKVLDNANSVIKSGRGKLWGEGDGTGKAQYQDDSGKHYDPHRGYVDEKDDESPYIAAPGTAIGDDKY